MDRTKAEKLIQQRKAVIVKVLNLIKEEMEEDGKNITIDYVEGILQEAIDTINQRSRLLPLKSVLKD